MSKYTDLQHAAKKAAEAQMSKSVSLEGADLTSFLLSQIEQKDEQEAGPDEHRRALKILSAAVHAEALEKSKPVKREKKKGRV